MMSLGNRTLLTSLLSVFLYAAVPATEARAESGEFLPASRIDSLCRPSSPLPCLVRVAATLRSATSGGPLRGKHANLSQLSLECNYADGLPSEER